MTVLLGVLLALLLPARIDPGAPFPHVTQEAPTVESIAPGIEYGEYQLVTDDGPLWVHVVAVEPHRNDVRVGSVLAANALESHGETIGSMARRTGAVAGINGDYFDIGNTNRPQNIVISGGALLQLPYKRFAIAITRDGLPHIAEFSFSGQLEIDQRMMPLDGIDRMPPPNGGLSLLTPEYGRVRPSDNVTLVSLAPLDGTPPLARYRVTGVADNLSAQPPGYYVAIGPNDYGVVDVPDVNATVTASGDLAPLGLDSIVAAIGGGPMILHGGQWYDDGDGPNGREYAKRIPSSGVAIAPNGRLFLIEVDGRQPEVSVGLKRPEFAALMRSLGATEGLALDGGGSSTLVARRLGESTPDVTNSPSDRIERPVGDGLFVYSTAPAGPPVRLVSLPSTVRAITGAGVGLRVAAVDAAYHVAEGATPLAASVSPPSLGVFRDGTFVALHPGSGHLVLRSNRLTGDVPIEVSATPARMQITPLQPNVDRNATLALLARAYDARGYPLVLPQTLRWSTTSGSIDGRGLFHAGSQNANVTARIGSSAAVTQVTVGTHEVALPFADRAHFVTIPAGGGGALTAHAGCASCTQLDFSFNGRERAAYAMADVALPAGTLGLSFDLQDDGSAGRLRVALRNAINEDVLLDAAALGSAGWRHVVIRFPSGTQAARLIAIYVLPAKGMNLSSGSVVLRNVRAVVGGQ